MTELTYEESIYNLNENMMSQMDQLSMQNHSQQQKEESIQGLLQIGQNNILNSDTKS